MSAVGPGVICKTLDPANWGFTCNNKEIDMKFVLVLALIIFVIVIGPVATIWAANALFPVLAIPYTIETWFAVVVLGAFFKTNVTYKK